MTTLRSTTHRRISVRTATVSDLGFLCDLHINALPIGFFQRLGRGFMWAYHRGFVESPFAVALMAEIDGRPSGFVVGTVDNGLHYRWVTHHLGVVLAAHGVGGLIRQPRLLLWFLRTRGSRYVRATARRLRRSQPTSADGQRLGVLSHIAVVPSDRGNHVGERLVEAFVGMVSEQVDLLEVVTLAGADGAAGFYHRMGWQSSQTFVTDGRSFERLAFTLR